MIDVPFAALYVQLLRHSRRMAGNKERLESWVHIAGVLCLLCAYDISFIIFGIVAWSLYSKSNRHRSEMKVLLQIHPVRHESLTMIKGINGTCLAFICLAIACQPGIVYILFFANSDRRHDDPWLVFMGYSTFVVPALCATPFIAAIYSSMRQDEENNSAVSDHVDTFEDMPDGYTMDDEISDDELDR